MIICLFRCDHVRLLSESSAVLSQIWEARRRSALPSPFQKQENNVGLRQSDISRYITRKKSSSNKV